MDSQSVSNEIQLISDGDGLAVIGDPDAVERFMAAEGLTSNEFRLPSLNQIISGVATIVDATSSIAESVSSIADSTTSITESVASIATNVGKWVKVSQDIVKVVEKYQLSASKTPGLIQAVVGQVEGLKGFAQVSCPGPRLLVHLL
jgi:methyl-accepting chemotaxis protein